MKAEYRNRLMGSRPNREQNSLSMKQRNVSTCKFLVDKLGTDNVTNMNNK